MVDSTCSMIWFTWYCSMSSPLASAMASSITFPITSRSASGEGVPIAISVSRMPSMSWRATAT